MKFKDPQVLKVSTIPSPHKKVKEETVWDGVCMEKQDTQYPPEGQGLHFVLCLHWKASHLKS